MKAKYLILLVCIIPLFGQAQGFNVDSLIKASAHVILHDSTKRFYGDGYSFLLQHASTSRFVMIAENHNTKEIPLFTAYLFNDLYREGFHHLALEQDPYTMRKLSLPSYKGKMDSIMSLAKKFPYSYTFTSDEELAMLASVSAVNAKGNVLWGLDQSFGICAPLHDLMGQYHSKVADSLYARAQSIEGKRDLEKQHFISRSITENDRASLRKLQAMNLSDDIRFGIHSVIMSDSIYHFMTTDRAYEGCTLREQYMKERFMEEYRLCQKQGEQEPKVLVKMGSSHIMDGFEPYTGAINVGTFIKQLAVENGSTAYSINAMIVRADTSDWDYRKYESKNVMDMFARNFNPDDWVLIDLGPLRSKYYNSGLKGILSKEDCKLLESYYLPYDALLLIGNGGDANFTICQCDY